MSQGLLGLRKFGLAGAVVAWLFSQGHIDQGVVVTVGYLLSNALAKFATRGVKVRSKG